MTMPQVSQEIAAPEVSAEFCSPQARPFVLVAAILASALGFIDGTVVSIALPAMRLSLQADLVQAQWIHNAYMLTLSSLILVGGALGDRFGLARIFASGIAVFVAASVFCAVAATPGWLISARTLQGVGAAIMVPGSLAIIARAYPRAERGRAIGLWAASSALMSALGPILGGLALTIGGPDMWRLIFAINLPLGGLALWLLWSKVGIPSSNSDIPVDVLGALTATLALLCTSWGLTQIGQSGSATPWLLAGLSAAALFLWIETRSAHPMIPLSLFRHPVFSAANLMAFVLYSALSIVFFFMPMTFIAGWGVSEIEASAAFAPMSVFISLLSGRAGRLADRIGPAPLLTVGSLLTATGYASLGYFAPEQDLWARALPSMCLVGIGMSLVVAPLSSAVMGAAPDAQSGTASGINNAVTRMAGLISVAAVGGLATTLYVGAGGSASFGTSSATAGHADAMNVAFAGLTYCAAALCIASAAISAIALRKGG